MPERRGFLETRRYLDTAGRMWHVPDRSGHHDPGGSPLHSYTEETIFIDLLYVIAVLITISRVSLTVTCTW